MSATAAMNEKIEQWKKLYGVGTMPITQEKGVEDLKPVSVRIAFAKALNASRKGNDEAADYFLEEALEKEAAYLAS